MAAEDGQPRWRWLPTGSSARLLPRAGVRAAPSVLVRDSPAVTIASEPAQQAGSGPLGRVQHVEDQPWPGSGNRHGGSPRSKGHREARAVTHRSAEGVGELALHLGEAAVNDLDCVFASCSAVTVRRLDPGHRHAPSRRQFLAAGQQVSGRKPRPPETSGPRFPASHPRRDHLELRGRSGYVTGSFNARRSHSSRGRAGRRSSPCRPDLI